MGALKLPRNQAWVAGENRSSTGIGDWSGESGALGGSVIAVTASHPPLTPRAAKIRGMPATRQLLEAERAQARRLLASLTGDFDAIVEASRGSNADDEHDPEGATIAYERAQVSALVRQVQAHVFEVEAALARLAQGRYGTCERCGTTISSGRLEARPTARTCIACASLSQ